MLKKLPFIFLIVVTFGLIDLGNALSSNENGQRLRIVGSSTLYPFVTVIAEEYTENFSFQAPIIEATGTGGGFNLLCTSNDADRPQLVSASRPIRASELALCAKKGIKNLKELKIGYDGIVISASNDSAFTGLSREEIYKALINQYIIDNELTANKNIYWNDVNKNLPKSKIEIYGPASTSGTRDVFEELVLEHICLENSKEKLSPELKQTCRKIRDGGYFIQVGENDNLIVQKLIANRYALGIFGYNFLQQNTNKVRGLKIDGYAPNYENISSNKYPISRVLYVYYDEDALLAINGAYEFLTELVSNEALSRDGYLIAKGLIPLTNEELKTSQNTVSSFKEKIKK